MQIVIEIGSGADDEVDETALHQLDHAAAQSCRCQRAGYREPDRRIVLGQQHFLREDAASFAEARRIEGLKAFIDELSEIGAASRPVIPDGLATQVAGTAFLRCAGCTTLDVVLGSP